MKRSLLLGLLVAAAPALARAQDPLKVVATIPDLAALARSIGGDGVEVTTLVKPGQNPHKVLAKASMTLTLHRADVLIEMGLSYEHAFLPAALLKCRNKRIAPGGPGFMNVSAGIKPVEVPATLDRGQGPDLHPQGNPHFNLDPDNGRIIARLIREVLQRNDPARAEQYQQNWEAWDARARARIEEWDALMAPVRGRKIAVYHRSWSYLVARYGLQVVGEVEPKPGLPPTAGHLKRLADAMLAGGVKVLVSEPWYSESQVAGLLKRTGARLVRLPTTSGLTPETADYLDYLDHLLRTLSGALQGTESGS